MHRKAVADMIHELSEGAQFITTTFRSGLTFDSCCVGIADVTVVLWIWTYVQASARFPYSKCTGNFRFYLEKKVCEINKIIFNATLEIIWTILSNLCKNELALAFCAIVFEIPKKLCHIQYPGNQKGLEPISGSVTKKNWNLL
jgi:hypothetical protein